MTHRLVLGLLLPGLLILSLPGCSSSGPEKQQPGEAAAEGESKAAEGAKESTSGSAPAAEEVLLEPFDAPPLAELDEKAEWVDQPVVDAVERLQKLLAEQQPLATVDEALALKNDSDEANAKILSALGRLPEDDSQVDWGASITRHILADVKTTNPIMVSSVQDFDLAGLTSLELFAFDWNLEFFANQDSVVSWQSSKDHLMDKVVLRDDLVWSDGRPLTAHDVVFSFQTIMNPKVPIPAVRSGTDELKWVEAYDDRTLVFFHKQALATNVGNMLFPIIPKHIYENTLAADPTLAESPEHVKYENEPVTSGPYKIVKRVRGQEIVLERRENHDLHEGKQVRQKPYIEQIRFRINADSNVSLLALKSGEIDELLLTPEQWMTQTGDDEFYSRNTKARGIEWTTFQFNWNLQTPFFSDIRVRKAMSYAFNHDEMLSKLCYGLYVPSNGVFHPAAWMAPKKPLPYYKQDLNKAEELLDEAGWIDHDGDGIRDQEIGGRSVPFEFNIVCTSVQLRVDICSLLKENLDQIGVICNVHPMEFTVMQEKILKHDYQAAFGGWGSGADPGTLDNIWKTGEPRNFGGYSNPEVDRLFDEGKKEFDRQKRAEIYAKIDELIYADQPYTWLYCQSSFYGFNKELRGYKFCPRGPYHYSPGFMSIWRPMH
ncbi:MAG TPA: peptide-binding protein [Pirellulales bacterium]|nr:peptide-binding protein [Pirellulales bacterium]